MSRHNNDVASLLKAASTSFPDTLKESINKAFAGSNGVEWLGEEINEYIWFCERRLAGLESNLPRLGKTVFCLYRLQTVIDTNHALARLVKPIKDTPIGQEITAATDNLAAVVSEIRGHIV